MSFILQQPTLTALGAIVLLGVVLGMIFGPSRKSPLSLYTRSINGWGMQLPKPYSRPRR
ncbi:MAG: hypothetical protein R3E01_06785 [Pirellulaceae bacterium]|nr:hypothetical protein [Planctomycetales bacterium]